MLAHAEPAQRRHAGQRRRRSASTWRATSASTSPAAPTAWCWRRCAPARGGPSSLYRIDLATGVANAGSAHGDGQSGALSEPSAPAPQPVPARHRHRRWQGVSESANTKRTRRPFTAPDRAADEQDRPGRSADRRAVLRLQRDLEQLVRLQRRQLVERYLQRLARLHQAQRHRAFPAVALGPELQRFVGRDARRCPAAPGCSCRGVAGLHHPARRHVLRRGQHHHVLRRGGASAGAATDGRHHGGRAKPVAARPRQSPGCSTRRTRPRHARRLRRARPWQRRQRCVRCAATARPTASAGSASAGQRQQALLPAATAARSAGSCGMRCSTARRSRGRQGAQHVLAGQRRRSSSIASCVGASFMPCTPAGAHAALDPGLDRAQRRCSAFGNLAVRAAVDIGVQDAVAPCRRRVRQAVVRRPMSGRSSKASAQLAAWPAQSRRSFDGLGASSSTAHFARAAAHQVQRLVAHHAVDPAAARAARRRRNWRPGSRC